MLFVVAVLTKSFKIIKFYVVNLAIIDVMNTKIIGCFTVLTVWKITELSATYNIPVL